MPLYKYCSSFFKLILFKYQVSHLVESLTPIQSYSKKLRTKLVQTNQIIYFFKSISISGRFVLQRVCNTILKYFQNILASFLPSIIASAVYNPDIYGKLLHANLHILYILNILFFFLTKSSFAVHHVAEYKEVPLNILDKRTKHKCKSLCLI